jgi:hypothetical protein
MAGVTSLWAATGGGGRSSLGLKIQTCHWKETQLVILSLKFAPEMKTKYAHHKFC